MRRSLITAGLMAAGLGLWLASGQLGSADPPPSSGAAVDRTGAPRVRPAFKVAVQRSTASPIELAITLNGRTEPARKVELKAEVQGRVLEVPVARGAPVAAGQMLVRLDRRDRVAGMKMAEAMLAQRQIEHDAAQKLLAKGFQAQTEAAAAAARLEEAKALVEGKRIGLGHSEIYAPFAGVLDRRPVEVGDYLDTGDALATVIELDPLLIVGHLAEAQMGPVRLGMAGQARTIAGDRLLGQVRYLASEAEPGTRTFRVELEVPNPGNRVGAGLSATMSLPLAPVAAHAVSSAALVLDDAGLLGVHIVDPEDIVRFVRARIVRAETELVWLADLPTDVRIIVVGQAFVRPGEKVVPVDVVPGTADAPAVRRAT